MDLDNYVDWLVNYISENKIIDIVYSSSNLLSDRENIKKLRNLYNSINEYLIEMYKLPVDRLDGISYVLKYNLHYFLICCDGETIFCREVSDYFSDKFIDYNDVKMYYLNKYKQEEKSEKKLIKE